jgi:hypothetical protein
MVYRLTWAEIFDLVQKMELIVLIVLILIGALHLDEAYQQLNHVREKTSQTRRKYDDSLISSEFLSRSLIRKGNNHFRTIITKLDLFNESHFAFCVA